MSKFIVQTDEHADEYGELNETDTFEVREVFENGDSEVVECCLAESQAVAQAESLS